MAIAKQKRWEIDGMSIMFRVVIILHLTAATLISAGVPSVFAQSQSDLTNAQRQAEKIQRDEQNRLQREIEQQRKKAGRPSEVEIPAPPQSTTPSGGPCITVRTIVIDSSPNLDADDRDRLTAPYVGTCMDKAAIETLMAEITADYIARGFSTTRVFLPAQDLSSGVLRIQVVEGVVGHHHRGSRQRADSRFYRLSRHHRQAVQPA
ncbi:MAG: hypothetical protein EPN26_00615 [Rhodospirillales bacterium]|nr:MAG: hypothetical protein EPN26_00615 [Rhodospirillales bacterium]